MDGACLQEPTTLDEVLASSVVPNIHAKMSGWHYVSSTPWAFPYPDVEPVVRAL